MSENRIPTDYSKEDLKIIEQQENQLRFAEFSNFEALEIAQLLQKLASTYENGIGVAIEIYDIDKNMPVLLYADEGKTERHLDYLRRKRNVVLQTGHCSFWAFVKNYLDGSYSYMKQPSDQYALTGGSFPIYVNDKLKYTLSVSGLHFGKDQEVIVAALCRYLHKEPLPFNKELW